MKIDIKELIKKQRLYFDGGTGTVLHSMGLQPGETPEEWNISHPDRIVDLHKAYLSSGSDIIKTNTFGINCDKYDNYKEMIECAVSNAKKAVSEYENKYIAFDIGPTGRLLEPLGDLSFENAVRLFAENIKVASKLGVDLILIETMNDSYETKAAVIAAKENCDLPIFVTNAYDESGKLMTGADPEAMVALLEGLGVDALGMNCSFGPDKMLEIIDSFTSKASVPVIVNPNAGLPEVHDGKTVYNITSDMFADYMVSLANKGACILGGCCGTTPEYIKKAIEKTRPITYHVPDSKNLTVISSYTHAVEIGEQPILIGERINPTGKPRLKEALRCGNNSYVLNEALNQTSKGVHILDVNVGLPGIDEKEKMTELVKAIQAVTDTPLQIDTSSPEVLENAMRLYNGKPLVNSVNGEKENMEAVFPLVKKYGGAVIALTMDKSGIPKTARERVAIALRIVDKAAEYGISTKDIIVDPLCLTVSSDKESAKVTLESIRLLNEAGLKTSLGVSNISFGLPQREKINSVFFTSALEKGLNCAIMNPYSVGMMDVYYAFRALHGLDTACADYIGYASENAETKAASQPENNITLKSAIYSGLAKEAIRISEQLIQTEKPLDIINNNVIPALDEIGKAFEQKKAYLPQLLMSAEAASSAFEVIKRIMPVSETNESRAMILATVKGDIHDIGKNIVKVLLESYGFKVYDIGRDVEPEKVLEAVKNTGCRLVGLSALMTTTLPSMADTVRLLKAYDENIRIVVGGAVLTQEYADHILADAYSEDAMDTVRYAEKYYG